jgi:CBS domain containing-hemolysin-like protein
MHYVLQILIVLCVVLLNALFVAAEFAIVKVRNTQIEPLAEKGNLRASIAREILAHLGAYLSATQLGITMTSLALGWIGEPLVATMIRPLASMVGIANEHAIDVISLAVGFSIITFLHITLGELAPKSLGIQKAQQTALLLAYPLRLFYLIFRPIINVLNFTANAILKSLGLEMVSGSELLHSEEELRLLLSQDKHVTPTSKSIVLNAMDFRRKQARHVMISRKEIVALSIVAPIKASLDIMRSNKFSRFPVYKDTIDNIVGIVHTKDIFRADRHLKPDFKLESVLRDAVFLPETATLEKALETMLQKKSHMIALADEFGGTAGILTLENILEELVGNIQDEFDREAPEVTKISDTEYVANASMTTNDIERLLNQELSPKEILSLGGWAIEKLGHLPNKGEKFRVDSTEFIIEEVNDRVIDTIRIKRLPAGKPKEKKK